MSDVGLSLGFCRFLKFVLLGLRFAYASSLSPMTQTPLARSTLALMFLWYTKPTMRVDAVEPMLFTKVRNTSLAVLAVLRSTPVGSSCWVVRGKLGVGAHRCETRASSPSGPIRVGAAGHPGSSLAPGYRPGVTRSILYTVYLNHTSLSAFALRAASDRRCRWWGKRILSSPLRTGPRACVGLLANLILGSHAANASPTDQAENAARAAAARAVGLSQVGSQTGVGLRVAGPSPLT